MPPVLISSSEIRTWAQPGVWLGVMAAAPAIAVPVVLRTEPSHTGAGGCRGITPSERLKSGDDAQAVQNMVVRTARTDVRVTNE